MALKSKDCVLRTRTLYTLKTISFDFQIKQIFLFSSA